MASDKLRQSVEVASHRRPRDTFGTENPSETDMEIDKQGMGGVVETMEDGEQSMQENCDNIKTTGAAVRTSSNKAVAPFLSRHIPDQYAPLGMPQTSITPPRDPNTKYCYRHHPDSKCRRTPDEPTMENIQTVCPQNIFVRAWTNWNSNLRLCQCLIDKPSHTSGLFSQHPPQNIAILCSKAFSPSAAFLNYPSSLQLLKT